MKTIGTFILLSFMTVVSYSQNVEKDSSIVFSSNEVKFSYFPTGLFSNISLATTKFKNGQGGIKFFFTTKAQQIPANIRIDSILLKSSTDEIVTLNNPFKDTVSFHKGGGLNLSIIYSLDENEIKRLKQYLITTLIVLVNERPLSINLKKNTQNKLQEILSKTL